MKQPGILVTREPLPAGWSTRTGKAHSLKENSDGTKTVKAEVILIDANGKKYSSGEQVHRCKEVKE